MVALLLFLFFFLWWRADDAAIEWDTIELKREAAIFVAPSGTDFCPVAFAIAGFANVECTKRRFFG